MKSFVGWNVYYTDLEALQVKQEVHWLCLSVASASSTYTAAFNYESARWRFI